MPSIHPLVRRLNGLIARCRDSEHAFRGGAARTVDRELKPLLSRRADECSRAAGELQAIVLWQLRGTPADGGSLAAACRRLWMSAIGGVRGFEDLLLLQACERSEARALRCFDRTLQEAWPASPTGSDDALRAAVCRHRERLLRRHGHLLVLCAHESRGALNPGQRPPRSVS